MLMCLARQVENPGGWHRRTTRLVRLELAHQRVIDPHGRAPIIPVFVNAGSFQLDDKVAGIGLRKELQVGEPLSYIFSRR